MPRYVIERQYLVQIFQHILVEAPSLEAACREALDDNSQPWDDSKIDWDSFRATTIAQAVELPKTLEPGLCPNNADSYDLSLLVYDCGLELIPIPAEFAEGGGAQEGVGFS